MTADIIISDFRNLFYQCEFRKLVQAVALAEPSLSKSQWYAARLLRTQALFELHQTREADAELLQLAEEGEEEQLYVQAKVAYQKQDYVTAEALFLKMAENCENVREYFRASLGVANVYLTTRNIEPLKRSLAEMTEMAELVQLDERLSFDLLQANYRLQVENQMQAARKTLYAVIEQATNRRWNYFIIKSLYSLALIYRLQGQKEGLKAHLELLRCYLRPGETMFLNYLINEQFKDDHFTIAEPLQLDLENRRLCVSGRWVEMHDRPLLFGFIEFLYKAQCFVAKKEIAEFLWPAEPYKPRVHDPRIFDIARRVRSLIESYEDQPVILLSGRYGYKLSTDLDHEEQQATAPAQAVNLA